MSALRSPYLVETDWLEQNLANPDVVVLDCTTHLRVQPSGPYRIEPGREDFETGHVRGAQFCDVSRDVSDTTQKFNFMRQRPEDFAAAMRRFQTGLVQNYAMLMLFGVFAFVSLYLFVR